METRLSNSMDRRHFLGRAGSVAALAVGAGVWSACDGGGESGEADGSTEPSGLTATSAGGASASSTGRSSAAPTTSGGSLLPAYVPSTKVKADWPATQLIPPGFGAYPAEPVSVTSGKPGKGSAQAMILVTSAVPPTLDKNPFWQELNQRLGLDLKIDITPLSGWSAKVQTTLAGGNLPDLMQLTFSFPNIADVLKADFEDLSPFLAGAASNDYPSLSTIPTASWKNVALNGGLYGVPYPQPSIVNFLMARSDLVQAKGLSLDLKDGQDFLNLCKGLTDVKKNRYAIGVVGTALVPVQQMVGVPNKWKIEGGAFTSQYETEEYKQALSIVNGMWKSGVMHPDAFTSTANLTQQFGSGQAALVKDGWSTWPKFLSGFKSTSPGITVAGVVLPKWDGSGQAGNWLGSQMYTYCALKKNSDKSRIKMLLAVLDWLAAPFGSAEYLFSHYGIKGRDYTLDGTDPVVTKTGTTEVTDLPIRFLANSVPAIYMPGQPDVVEAIYDFEVELAKATVAYPLAGLYSPTALTNGATIDKNIGNVQSDILQGRKSLSAWDGAVKAWRSGGGDQIRSEYEKAYAEARQ